MRMPGRLTLMMTLSGGLYLGPFLAGLSHQPGWSVILFAATLAAWSILYQRGSWPPRVAELRNPAVATRAAIIAGAMLALAGIFFLAGMGLSFLVGTLPLPLKAAVAVPVVSLGLATVLQSPRKAREMDAFLDEALIRLEGMGTLAADSGQAAMAARFLDRITALPHDAAPGTVLAALQGSDDLDAAFLSAVDKLGPSLPRPVAMAAILIVTDLDRAPPLAGRGEAAWVFDLARRDHALTHLFAERALALVRAMPDMGREMPYAHDVEEARRGAGNPDTAGRLGELRDRLNALSADSDT